MTTFISILALAFASGLSLLFLFGWILFLAEGHRRPLVVMLLCGLPLLAGCHAMWMLEYPGKTWIVIAVVVLTCIAALVLLLPWGKNKPLQITGTRHRVDERDALFHRFYRLEEGTPEFDAFYKTHPEKRDFDEQVRQLPRLGQPGSKTWDPLTSPFQNAAFSLTHDLTRELDWQPAPVEGGPVEATPEEFSLRVKGLATSAGAKLVGCTRLDPAYIYSHIGRSPGEWGSAVTLDHTHAVAIAVEMSHEMIQQAPGAATTTETAIKYLEAAKIAMLLARYINLLGYEARAHVDGNYRVMCVPIAADAGLGELGRLGLLMTPRYGPRIRLAVVTTNMPLAQDEPIATGIQDFCSFCKRCADACPSGAIDKGEKRQCNGTRKWQSDQESCYRYWRLAGSDCAICVKVCPYSHEDNLLHNLVRYFIRQNPLSRRVALWAGDLLYGRRAKKECPVPPWHG